MSESEILDTLISEEENDEPAFVEFDISVSPSDPTLELLSNQVRDHDIIIPPYQRKFVWTIEQASKLIESFLMGLPVPQVFFYINEENQLEVIDGQQRILSIRYFMEGFFGEADAKGKRQEFRLKGLSYRSEYNGKKFVDLPPRDQRKFKNSTLRAINIKQLKPKFSNDSVFHIFERLNTGGTQLKPQEIRNAVYRGKIVDSLQSLNLNTEWQSILGLSKPDKNQKDVELVLRLFGLYKDWNKYEKPMLSYLNMVMASNRDFSSEKCESFTLEFARVTKLINNAIKKPFRPNRVLNSAALEAVMITLLENSEITEERLKKGYKELIEKEEFKKLISGGTTDDSVLKKRIELAKEII